MNGQNFSKIQREGKKFAVHNVTKALSSIGTVNITKNLDLMEFN